MLFSLARLFASVAAPVHAAAHIATKAAHIAAKAAHAATVQAARSERAEHTAVQAAHVAIKSAWWQVPGATVDVLALCAVIAMVSMGSLTILNTSIKGWDRRFLLWLSNVMSTPAWSISWWFIIVGWLAMRFLLYEYFDWFREWGDNVVITVLFAVSPYVVENAMKYSTAQQMAEIQSLTEQIAVQNEGIARQAARISDLTTAIRAQLDDSKDQADLLHAMVERLLDAIEAPCDHAEEAHAIVSLAEAVRFKLGAEVASPFKSLVSQLVDAILRHPEAV